jgi:hypothetical protein
LKEREEQIKQGVCIQSKHSFDGSIDESIKHDDLNCFSKSNLLSTNTDEILGIGSIRISEEDEERLLRDLDWNPEDENQQDDSDFDELEMELERVGRSLPASAIDMLRQQSRDQPLTFNHQWRIISRTPENLNFSKSAQDLTDDLPDSWDDDSID